MQFCQTREHISTLWKCAENFRRFRSETNDDRHRSIAPRVSQGHLLPINVFRFERGHVGLGTAQMPEHAILVRFISGVKDSLGRGFVAGLQALLFPRRSVFNEEDSVVPLKQSVSQFHQHPHGC